MQTFLPYPEFADSAASLDNRRLNKQIVEAYQIMQALLIRRGWIHHPATKMWAGHEWELLLYIEACNDERMRRGYSTHASTQNAMRLYFNHADAEITEMPWWVGNPDFHLSHQSNLVRKDPDHYGPLFPGVPDNLPYIWPI